LFTRSAHLVASVLVGITLFLRKDIIYLMSGVLWENRKYREELQAQVEKIRSRLPSQDQFEITYISLEDAMTVTTELHHECSKIYAVPHGEPSSIGSQVAS
jgi:hypothetical protein